MTMETSMDGVAGQEWAQRVRKLSPQERARRLEAVEILLAEPDDLCGALESELYALQGQLKGQDG